MAPRAAILEHPQLGAESTAGTAVAANRNILAWGIDCDPQVPDEEIRPEGHKYPTGLLVGKDWTDVAIKGALSFPDIIYPLCGLLKNVSPTTPSYNGTWTITITGTPTGGTWSFTWNGATATGIAYNVNAATLQTTLESIATIGSGNVLVTGGPGPGTPFTVTLRGALQYSTLQVTVAHAFTGGSAPDVAATSTAASAARLWTWDPSQSAEDTIKTFTVEKGQSSGASKFAYGFFSDLEIAYTRKSVGISAKMFGRTLQDGISLTGSPTDVPNIPVSVPQCSVWLGSTLLGMTKLTTPLSVKWGVKGQQAPVFTINDDQSSYQFHVTDEAAVMAQLTVVHDSEAEAYLTALKATSERYFRMRAVGANIESGYPYLVEITMPFRFRNPKRANSDGVYASTFDLMAAYSSSYQKAFSIRVLNGQTSL